MDLDRVRMVGVGIDMDKLATASMQLGTGRGGHAGNF